MSKRERDNSDITTPLVIGLSSAAGAAITIGGAYVGINRYVAVVQRLRREDASLTMGGAMLSGLGTAYLRGAVRNLRTATTANGFMRGMANVGETELMGNAKLDKKQGKQAKMMNAEGGVSSMKTPKGPSGSTALGGASGAGAPETDFMGAVGRGFSQMSGGAAAANDALAATGAQASARFVSATQGLARTAVRGFL